MDYFVYSLTSQITITKVDLGLIVVSIYLHVFATYPIKGRKAEEKFRFLFLHNLRKLKDAKWRRNLRISWLSKADIYLEIRRNSSEARD